MYFLYTKYICISFLVHCYNYRPLKGRLCNRPGENIRLLHKIPVFDRRCASLFPPLSPYIGHVSMFPMTDLPLSPRWLKAFPRPTGNLERPANNFPFFSNCFQAAIWRLDIKNRGCACFTHFHYSTNAAALDDFNHWVTPHHQYCHFHATDVASDTVYCHVTCNISSVTLPTHYIQTFHIYTIHYCHISINSYMINYLMYNQHTIVIMLLLSIIVILSGHCFTTVGF